MTVRDEATRSCLPHSLEAAARLSLSRLAESPQGATDAARFLGAAQALCDRLGIAMLPVERALFKQTLARVREVLDEASFLAAWHEGASAEESSLLSTIL